MALIKKASKSSKPTFVSHILANGENDSCKNTKVESCFYVTLNSHNEMHLEANLLPGEIVISQLGKVTRYAPYSNDNSGQIGTLFVTNYKVSYVTILADSGVLSIEDKSACRQNKLIGKDDIALTNIMEIYHTSKGRRKKLVKGSLLPKAITPAQCLELHCKDFRLHSFSFENCERNEVCKMINSIVHHAFPLKTDLLFVFSFEMDKCYSEIDLRNISNYMSPGDWITELRRLLASSSFRVTSCNAQYALTENLPEYFVVPSILGDKDIVNEEAELEHRAIPIWSYSNLSGYSIIRLAYGSSDEVCARMLELVRKSNPNEQPPKEIDLGKIDLPSLRDLQLAYERLREQCMPPTNKDLWSSDLTWYSALENSQWLLYVARTISVACGVVHIMSVDNKSVVLKERNGGTDFSPVVSSLAQLMMDRDSRTLTGFQNLVEREWVALGHRFADRCGVIYQTEDGESPLFLLFLDCVWQLLQQFPSSFEFSEIYLTSIWDSVGLAMFQNFLFNGPRHRSSVVANLLQRLRIPTAGWNLSNYLMSAWDWQRQFSVADIALFVNPLYVARGQIQEWQSHDSEFNEAFGQIAKHRNGHKSGSLTPKQTTDDMRTFRRIQSLHSATESVRDVLRPGFAMPQIRPWEHCYLRWVTPIQIVGGGMPCEFLAQTILVNEVQTLQDEIAKLELRGAASANVNFPKTPKKVVGPKSSLTSRMLERVSSSFPFSIARPSNLSIIPAISPTPEENPFDDFGVEDSFSLT